MGHKTILIFISLTEGLQKSEDSHKTQILALEELTKNRFRSSTALTTTFVPDASSYSMLLACGKGPCVLL